MLRAWRRATAVALAGSTAMAGLLAAVVPARAATSVITVAAASNFRPVTGDVFVEFQGSKSGSARIHGTITGAAAGEVATVYAQRFPYATAAKPVGSITLSETGTTTYSFTVTPTLATRYQVKLFASKNAANPLATSARQNVYVVNNGRLTGLKACGRPVCHEALHIFTIVPRSALGVEMKKHLYPYFGLNLSATSTPPYPRWLYLNTGHATVSAARRISATEFERTLTFTFTIGNDGAAWNWSACVKDKVSTDGLGLPGSHGCGAHRVLATAYYLG